MRQWMLLFQKELIELCRSYKIIWLPAVFLLLGISQPISTYFLPELLASAGNLPKEILEMPLPQSGEVLAQTLQQFGMIGALIIALAFMGAVSGELSSGVASMILVKPVSHGAFLLSKWTAMILLLWLSFLLGYLGSWYYSVLLIGGVDGSRAIQGLFVYGLWLSLIGTFTIGFSVWLRSPAAAAFAALGLTLVLNLSASLLPEAMAWSPGQLPGLASAMLVGGIDVVSSTVTVIIVTFSLILVVIGSSLWKMKRIELQ